MSFSLNTDVYDIEDFDDEIVLVNIQTGVYFTMAASAPLILRGFMKGLNLSKFLDDLSISSLDLDIKDSVQNFIQTLIQETIIVENSNIEIHSSIDLNTIHSSPIYKKFEDMGDLIKLDPIHEVSDLGWPNKLNHDS